MNKLKFILILFLFINFTNISVFSQGIVIDKSNDTTPAKKTSIFEIELHGDIKSSSSYFDKDKKNQMTDTIYYRADDDTVDMAYPYTTDFEQEVYYINFKVYNPFDVCFIKDVSFFKTINLELPFVSTSIEEKFMYDSLNYSRRYTRNKDGRFGLDGISLGINVFDMDIKPINFKIFSNLYFPIYKYKSKSDSTNDIMNNKRIELGRETELMFGGSIFSSFSTVCLGLTGAYEYRAGDFSDRILTNFHFGFSSVKNTEIYLSVDYIWSLGDYKDEYKVSHWRTNLYEKYSNVGVGFRILFTENLYANVGYKIRVWGTNSIAENIVLLNVGYIFLK